MARYKLLPPNLQDEDIYKDFADAVDKVFKTQIDDPRSALQSLIDAYPFMPNTDGVRSLMSNIQVDRQTFINLAKDIGFSPSNPTLYKTEDFYMLYSTLGMYYREKGSKNFINYFGYVLNSVFTVERLWTQDFVVFYPEGDVHIGTPIYQGGTWYPTSHVNFKVDMEKYGGYSQTDITKMFYDIAPINLVMKAFIYESSSMNIFHLAMAGSMIVSIGSTILGSDQLNLAVSGSMQIWQQ